MAQLTYEELENVHINPKLVLYCAELVSPGTYEIYLPYAHEHPVIREKIGNGYTVEEFDPLYSTRDAYALEGALMEQSNGGWVFGKHYTSRDQRHWAISVSNGFKVLDDTRAMMLYKCASMISNIPLQE